MGIIDVISSKYTQVAVYWGNPISDGEGGHSFDSPIELSVRWEEMSQIVADSKGNELTSRATVYVNQDLDEEGMLFFGTLNDLDSDEVRPKSLSKAYYIRRFERSPILGSTNQFLRKAYLTPSLSFGSM
jgi:hypothetical protein